MANLVVRGEKRSESSVPGCEKSPRSLFPVNGTPAAFDYDDDGLLTDAGDLALARDASNGLVTGTTQATATGSRDYR